MFIYYGYDYFEGLHGANGEPCDLEDIESNISDEEELVEYLNDECIELNNSIKKATQIISVDNIDYEDGTDGSIRITLYSDIELSEDQLNALNETISDLDDYFSMYSNIEFEYRGKEK